MTDPASGGEYEIRVRGNLDAGWSEWFEGLQVEAQGQDTSIRGQLPDQAAVHGLLNKVRDLGLFLISVRYREPADRNTVPEQ